MNETDPAAATLGRTGATVPRVWRQLTDRTWGENTGGGSSWCALLVGRDTLDRRGEAIVREHLTAAGRTQCDLLIAEHIDGGDLKAGWPMHRLQQFRDRGLCRFFALRTTEPLEAEWIATHTPVHAILIDYSPDDMAARYRVFDAANLTGTAVLAIATSVDAFALQQATPQITATLCAGDFDPAAALTLDATAVEIAWQDYAATHAEPPKLKGVHPPEE